ncbi:hypothetical protein Tco_1040959 [Tanacetum coccineum]|uniref:Uncharacterized protein n=1 Tax=Tanacetum coccineum TaxID=301880 RepID=A0ABQ5GFP4_9ASTR
MSTDYTYHTDFPSSTSVKRTHLLSRGMVATSTLELGSFFGDKLISCKVRKVNAAGGGGMSDQVIQVWRTSHGLLAGGASNRYMGTRLPMDVAEYQMPLLREIEICLKKKCDKLADAFIDSDLGEGTVVNASPCAEVVARSSTWLGRVLSCVCAQSIEDDSRPSFDLTPAQVELEYCCVKIKERASTSIRTIKRIAFKTLSKPDFDKPEHRWKRVHRLLIEAIEDILSSYGKDEQQSLILWNGMLPLITKKK